MVAVVTGLKKRTKNLGKWMAWRLGLNVINPPHPIKQRMVRKYQRASGAKVLVETGTYLGEMVEAQLRHFDLIYSIELSGTLYERARSRFSGSSKVRLVQGDSGVRLPEIVNALDQKAVFWLDGHYSGGITAQAEKDCPVVLELYAILASRLDHTILIDDARLFDGTNDYPTLQEIDALLRQHEVRYTLNIEADIIVIRYAR